MAMEKLSIKEGYARLLNLEKLASLQATKSTLDMLVQRHYESICFENIDMVLRRPCTLNQAELVQKILVKRRGGSCLELNALFWKLLIELGFEGHLVLSDIFFAEQWVFGHCIIIVQMDACDYLVDVGNQCPQGLTESLCLRNGFESKCSNGIFRTFTDDKWWQVVRQSDNETHTKILKWPVGSKVSLQEAEAHFQTLLNPQLTHIPDLIEKVQISRKFDGGKRCLSLRMARLNVHETIEDGSISKDLVEDFEDFEKYVNALEKHFLFYKEQWTKGEIAILSNQLFKRSEN